MISPGDLAVHSAVVDTGPLIHLHEIGRLDLATTVFSSIHLPEHVEREIYNDPSTILFSSTLTE